MKIYEEHFVPFIAVAVLSLLSGNVYAQAISEELPNRNDRGETRSDEIARLAWYIEIGSWELKSQSITDVHQLVRANQGRDMTDFVPVVKPLIANIGWGGIARWDTQNAVETLAMIGEPAVPALIDSIVASEARLRWASAEVLAKIRRDAGLVIMLAPLAEDQDPYVRRVYYRCLGSAGEAANKATPVLLKAAAEDPVPENRLQCLRALIQITGEAEPHVADIASYLKHEDRDIRRLASTHLGDCGSLAQSCVSELLQSLKDTDAQVRVYAASSLGSIGTGSDQVVEELIETLETDREREVRRAAASALGSIGSKARQAVPTLTKILREADRESQGTTTGWWVASRALGEIGGEDALAALTEAQENADPDIRRTAKQAIEKTKGSQPETETSPTQS